MLSIVDTGKEENFQGTVDADKKKRLISVTGQIKKKLLGIVEYRGPMTLYNNFIQQLGW